MRVLRWCVCLRLCVCFMLVGEHACVYYVCVCASFCAHKYTRQHTRVSLRGPRTPDKLQVTGLYTRGGTYLLLTDLHVDKTTRLESNTQYVKLI